MFKTGDEVVCVSNELSKLELNHIYTVSRVVDNEFLNLVGRGDIPFGSERFKKHELDWSKPLEYFCYKDVWADCELVSNNPSDPTVYAIVKINLNGQGDSIREIHKVNKRWLRNKKVVHKANLWIVFTDKSPEPLIYHNKTNYLNGIKRYGKTVTAYSGPHILEAEEN